MHDAGPSLDAELWPSSKDYLEVYVSAVDTAGHFWVQVLGTRSAELDALINNMTEYYTSPHCEVKLHSFLRKQTFIADIIIIVACICILHILMMGVSHSRASGHWTATSTR